MIEKVKTHLFPEILRHPDGDFYVIKEKSYKPGVPFNYFLGHNDKRDNGERRHEMVISRELFNELMKESRRNRRKYKVNDVNVKRH